MSGFVFIEGRGGGAPRPPLKKNTQPLTSRPQGGPGRPSPLFCGALMSNLIEWLTPSTVISADDIIHPGDAITVRPAVGEQAVGIFAPDGELFTAGVSNAGALFADTNQLGIYSVATASTQEGRKFSGFFAVNLFDAQESNIRPAETLTIGRAQVAASVRNQVGQRELWPYVAAAALAILLIEWWVYHRGSSLPA